MCEEQKFEYEAEVEKIKDILEDIGDKRTVIMAPDMGSSNKDPKDYNKKLRIYSHGGKIIKLSTSKNAKCLYLPDDGYVPKGEDVATGAREYSELDKKAIFQAIRFAEKRANGGKKAYNERSVETALIYKNRQDNNPSAYIIDMEFTCPKDWLGKAVTMRNGKKSTTGKPDLVIYDRMSRSFGIVELKYKNKSIGNMEKHFVDFTNIVKSDEVKNIKKEFCRKIEYLNHYKIIPKISKEDLDVAMKSDIWMAFLFVEGTYEECKNTYNKAIERISTNVDRKKFGFKYYSSMDDRMEFSKKVFGI